MKIRFGTYTLYRGIEMLISELYGHGLDPDIEQNYRIISYPMEFGFLDDFNFNPESKIYTKDVLVKDLDNAYSVVMKAYYNGNTFDVHPYYSDDIHYHLATKDLVLGKEMGFHELHDGHGKPYYLGEIKISEIEKIWEERSVSSYTLPMPKGIELLKELS